MHNKEMIYEPTPVIVIVCCPTPFDYRDAQLY